MEFELDESWGWTTTIHLDGTNLALVGPARLGDPFDASHDPAQKHRFEMFAQRVQILADEWRLHWQGTET